MKSTLIYRLKQVALGLFMTQLIQSAPLMAAEHRVGKSPWGPDDEIGRLNLISKASQQAVLSRINGAAVYDLSVEYFIGMPSWQAAGDPHYRIWMTHTPHGTVVDDPLHLGEGINRHVSYTGAAISLYTHMGTHIDALNHFGLNGEIWNGFKAQEHLGDRGWSKAGAENIPPIIARGVMIDVAAAKSVEMLADGYRVTRDDLLNALAKQNVSLQQGDVVLIRTGRMKTYKDAQRYMENPPGMGMAAARFLVEESGAMIVGADNLSFEAFPSEVKSNYVPLHTYLLAEQGVPIMELVNLEELSRDGIYEFAFIGGSLKLRGSDAAPMRPLAFPLTPVNEGIVMINISALAHIGIRVSNFKHAIHFYKQLGFSVIRDDKHERVVVLKHACGIEINLLDSVNSKNYKQNILMDVPTRYAGYTHMALRVADIQKSANAIRLLGIEITEGPLKFGDGSTSIFFRDPDKNVIELSQALRHFKSFTENTKNIEKKLEL